MANADVIRDTPTHALKVDRRGALRPFFWVRKVSGEHVFEAGFKTEAEAHAYGIARKLI